MKSKDTRILFDKDFYILQAIFLTPKFEQRVKEMKTAFAHLDCAMPKNGFDTAKSYYDWRDKLYKTGEVEFGFLEDILTGFGLDPKNDTYMLGLKWKIFFNRQKAPLKGLLQYSVEIDKERNAVKLQIEILEQTNQQDFDNLWPLIELAREDLVKQNNRNREWEYFERDNAIYMLSRMVGEKRKLGHIISSSRTPSRDLIVKNIIDLTMEQPELKELERKYGKITYTITEKAIKRCYKTLQGVNLL